MIEIKEYFKGCLYAIIIKGIGHKKKVKKLKKGSI
jgi:hypothetical protein